MTRIEIQYDVGRLTPNKRDFWATKASNVKACRFLAEQAWKAAGSPRWTAPVVCQITIYRGRVLDPDSRLAACKAAIDGVFSKGRALPDDSGQWIEYPPVRMVTGDRFKARPSVLFEITPKETENV